VLGFFQQLSAWAGSEGPLYQNLPSLNLERFSPLRLRRALDFHDIDLFHFQHGLIPIRFRWNFDMLWCATGTKTR
jgi:hypothetical protein